MRNKRFGTAQAQSPSPALREKVASVSEPDEGPALQRRNEDSYDLSGGTTLTLPLRGSLPLPQCGRGAFAAAIPRRFLSAFADTPRDDASWRVVAALHGARTARGFPESHRGAPRGFRGNRTRSRGRASGAAIISASRPARLGLGEGRAILDRLSPRAATRHHGRILRNRQYPTAPLNRGRPIRRGASRAASTGSARTVASS